MLDAQTLWIMVHVVLLVYWLGADISVFYSSFQLIKTENSPETRAADRQGLGLRERVSRHRLDPDVAGRVDAG